MATPWEQEQERIRQLGLSSAYAANAPGSRPLTAAGATAGNPVTTNVGPAGGGSKGFFSGLIDKTHIADIPVVGPIIAGGAKAATAGADQGINTGNAVGAKGAEVANNLPWVKATSNVINGKPVLSGIPGLGGAAAGGPVTFDLGRYGQAPTATAATLGQAAQARAEQIAAPGQAQASFAAGPTMADVSYTQAALAAAPQLADTRRASFVAANDPTYAATQGYTAQQVAAQRVLEAARYDPVLAQAVQIDQAASDAARAQLMGLASQYQAGIDGTAPSAAEALFRRNAESAANQQLGLAATAARGGNTALALRRAGMNIGQLQAQAANDAAIMRAQEVAQNRNALAGLLANVRSSDIGLATSQAQLTQQNQLANAGFFNAAGQFNAGQANEMLRTQEQLGAQRDLFNVGALNAANQFSAQQQNETARQFAALQNSVNLQNSSLATQTEHFNAGQYNEAQRQLAGLLNQQEIANAGFRNSTNQFNSGAYNQATQQLAGLQNAANLANAQIANETNRFNVGANNQQALAQAQLNQQTALANFGAQNQFALAQAGFNQQANLANLQSGLTFRGQNIQAETSRAAIERAAQADAATRNAALMGLIGGGLGGAFGQPVLGASIGSSLGQAGYSPSSLGWW